MNYPFISGDRLYFRAVEPEDLEHCLRWYNDPLITATLGGGTRPISRLAERKFIEEAYDRKDRVILAVCLSENDLHIGDVSLDHISHVDRRAEIAITIGERTLHRKGYGTEAVKLLLNYAFDRLNLERVYLTVLENNEPALGCYKKIGFVEEGRLRQHTYKNGKYCDEIIMGLLKADWTNQ